MVRCVSINNIMIDIEMSHSAKGFKKNNDWLDDFVIPDHKNHTRTKGSVLRRKELSHQCVGHRARSKADRDGGDDQGDY